MTEAQRALFGIDQLNVPRSIPAVTHVDYPARVQTVHRETNPRYWELLLALRTYRLPSDCEYELQRARRPIVGSLEDAFRRFMGTEIETLAVGNWFSTRADRIPP